MSRSIDVLALATAAIKFAHASADTAAHREQLTNAYFDWREQSGTLGTHITRGDENWVEMMTATNEEFRLWTNAKSREHRAKKKLIALAGKAEREGVTQ